MAQNLPRGTPARVLVLLSLLTGLVTVSVWRDALQRPGNSWVRYPTALGDTGLLQTGHLPASLETPGGRVALTAGGAPLRRRDDRMFRVETGLEAGLPFTLFTTGENLAANPDPKLYARTAPHEYLRLRARMVDPSAPPPLPLPSSEPAAPAVAGRPPLLLQEKASPPVKPSPVAGKIGPVEGKGAQVVAEEDPDQALALPAALPEPPAIPVMPPPDLGGTTTTPPAPPPVPEPAAPKAIPLPPDEQDSPVAEPAQPTL